MTEHQLRMIEDQFKPESTNQYRSLDERTRRIGLNGVRRARAAMRSTEEIPLSA